MTALLVENHAWTLEDWLAIPETHQKIEFIEGALFVMGFPTWRHQRIVLKLMLLLEQTNPDQSALGVVPEVDVVVGRNGFGPDVVVAPPTDIRPVDGRTFALAVEVESPSSLGNDRVMKPAALARERVPSYWRIEPDPLVVHIYELRGDRLEETQMASGDQMVQVTQPWPLSFRVSELEP